MGDELGMGVLGSLRGGQVSGMLRANFGPREPLLSLADSESARNKAQSVSLGCFGTKFGAFPGSA
eukprot:6771864-Alexandrium_andersonii.AAC.1